MTSENARRLRSFIVVVMEMHERDRYFMRAKVARDILDYMDDILDRERDEEERVATIKYDNIDAMQLAKLMAEDSL
jgi:hypothetical protein